MQRESHFAVTPSLRLLEFCTENTQSDAAYLYGATEPVGVELIARTGIAAPGSSEHNPDAAFPAQRTVIIACAWNDPRLRALPGFAPDRIESAVIIPVDSPPARAALVVGRLQPTTFEPLHLALFEAAALGLGAALLRSRQGEELSRLRAELERTRERLAARKTIERAKGIIQARDACTEGEAYNHLRRLSRTTREPMTEIARRVIQRSAAAA